MVKPTIIKVTDDGPYEVSGSFEITDAVGNSYNIKKGASLCRCGQSKEMPFCDGTEQEIGFNSSPRKEDKDLMVEV